MTCAELDEVPELTSAAPIKLGVTGSRKGWTKEQEVTFQALVLSANEMIGISEFHHGDCIGVDADALTFIRAMNRSIRCIAHPSTHIAWRAYTDNHEIRPTKDPLVRNRFIIKAIDHLIGIPSESVQVPRGGTWYTLRHAAKAGIPYRLILPNGKFGKLHAV